MAFADRIQTSPFPKEYPAGSLLPIHELTAAFHLYWLGTATRNQIVSLFNLDASEQVGLDALLAALDGQANETLKVKWLMKLDAAGIYYQNGNITIDQYKAIMGL